MPEVRLLQKQHKRTSRETPIFMLNRILQPGLAGVANYFCSVKFFTVSSLIYQLAMSPLMNPEMATNSSTTTLTAVKILFIVVDSLTPNASTPMLKTHSVFYFIIFFCVSVYMTVATKTTSIVIYLTTARRER